MLVPITVILVAVVLLVIPIKGTERTIAAEIIIVVINPPPLDEQNVVLEVDREIVSVYLELDHDHHQVKEVEETVAVEVTIAVVQVQAESKELMTCLLVWESSVERRRAMALKTAL